MKGVSSKQEDSDGLMLWLARPLAYAGALVLYAVAVCVAGVLAHGRRSPSIAFFTGVAVVKEAATKAVEALRASPRFRWAPRD
jgi:hypothetical protein